MVTQKAIRETEREREISKSMLPNMNARSSVRPKLMFKARITARMFGMVVVIPKTMTIGRTMRRNEEGIEIWANHLRR